MPFSLFLIAQFFWELPQNILGCLVWIVIRTEIDATEIRHSRMFFRVPNFGVSLGSFVFWSESDNAMIKIKSNNKAHEFGHTIQSKRMGPLYLLLVGLPSIMRVIYGSLYFSVSKTKWRNYYNGYPEKWADRLGDRYFENTTG